MNTTLGECIDNLETERGNALEGQRARREQRALKSVKARMKKPALPSRPRARRKHRERRALPLNEPAKTKGPADPNFETSVEGKYPLTPFLFLEEKFLKGFVLMSDTHIHVHVPQTASVLPLNDPFVAVLTITFRITTDDKEHQDAIAVQVIDTSNQVVFDREIVPATGDNGNSDDPNAYYWPSDDGRRPHSFVLGLSNIVPISQFNGSKITIRSYTYGGHSDFESWIGNVDVQATGSFGTRSVLLNGAASQTVNWQNNGSPGAYTYTMTLGG